MRHLLSSCSDDDPPCVAGNADVRSCSESEGAAGSGLVALLQRVGVTWVMRDRGAGVSGGVESSSNRLRRRARTGGDLNGVRAP